MDPIPPPPQSNLQPPPVVPMPPPSPPTPAKPKNWLIISLLILVMFLSLGATGFFAYQNYQLKHQISQTQPTPLASPKPTAEAEDVTANWKTYTTSKGDFSFKYPEHVFPVEMGVNSPHFYASQNDASDAGSCFANHTGTIVKPCSSGLFDVYPARVFDTLQESTGSTPTYNFTDNQNRKWFIVEPVYGLGGTETNAEVVLDHTYRIEIHIYDSFMKGQTDNDIQKQKGFIQQILPTFKFLSQNQSVDINTVKTACIALENSSKNWDDTYKECDEGGATKAQFLTFCSTYGGKFEDNVDVCRHTTGPCGPQATYTCSFSTNQQTGSYSSEGQSCGALAGPAGNAVCAPGLTCQHKNPTDPNDIGTCVK